MTTRDLAKETLVDLEKAHIDNRGEIQPLVDRMMRSAVLITSKKARRATTTQIRLALLLTWSPQMEYYERPTGSKEKPKCLIGQGRQMVFHRPSGRPRHEVFRDTTWLTLSRNPRQDSYEADVAA